MVYTASITTPKITYPRTSPLRTILPINKGLVYKVEFDFPPGSAGLLGCMISDGGFQVWPSSLGSWFTGDSIVIGFDDVYLKESAPYQFNIFTYNDDDTYEHLIHVRIGLVTNEIFMARFLPSMAYKDFAEALLQIQAEQTVIVAEQAQGIINNPFPWLNTTEE
ncbi:hypothetical protein LCGC14_1348350 [marine sediment metagenome]|uniref:Uncharacterized protein n=1 Tax=marine sediment metagenome TaxID=412755 RepID=A0A0F9KXM8_9ZZZZ